MGSKSRTLTRSKKRKFGNNQHSNISNAKSSQVSSDEKPDNTASNSKLNNNSCDVTGYVSQDKSFIVDLACLDVMFSAFNCPECAEKALTVQENTAKRMGCCTELQLVCHNCGFISQPATTSKKVGQTYEVNRRLVYAMRQVGCGYNEARHFMCAMNLPPPPKPSAYNNHTKALLPVVKKLANETMITAAFRVRKMKDTSECGATIDGTWQKRGYSSLNGVVTALSVDTGEVLDVEVLNKVCHGCRAWSTKDKSSADYQRWLVNHTCSINHKGSAGNMEPVGAGRIFERSKKTRGLEYTEFYGDGDSKSYLAVCELQPYPNKSIAKKECVGHYQKRLGTALRKLKKTTKGLGGKGKLTEAKIDKMQNYFGIALRNNTSSVKQMSNAIWSTFFHLSSTDEHPLHSKCPKGKDSWCSYQRATAAGKADQFKHKGGLPLNLLKFIKPVYERLTDPVMLAKCLHGKTQNPNESFHSMIWKRCPKTKFAGSNVVKLATFDAAMHFNAGSKVELEVMKRMGIHPGFFMVEGIQYKDQLRISESVRQSTPRQKLRRKFLRGQKKRKDDTNSKKEGKSYGGGDF